MMKITFINGGYAEGLLIECQDPTRKNGKFIMTVDGGSNNDSEFAENASGRIRMADYLEKAGIDHIDLMVSTHTHEDYLCGQKRCAEILKPAELWQTLPDDLYQHFPKIDGAVATNLSQSNFIQALNDYVDLCSMTAEAGGIVRQVSAGYMETPCKDLKITVLAPSDDREEMLREMMEDLYASVGTDEFLTKLNGVDSKLNNFSVILVLEYKGRRVVLPGDTNQSGYDDFTAEDLLADLFKVGHHGQIDGSSAEVMEKVQPSMVVCCASSDRRYNSAHPDMIAMIESFGARMYYSDCPVEGIQPHEALVFTLDEACEWTVEYR